MKTLKDHLQETVKDKFKINISQWKDIDRPWQYPIVTAILRTDDGKQFFLKESKEYTTALELDQIYAELECLRNRQPRLVCLPLKHRSGMYSFSMENKTFHLFEFIDLKDLDKNIIHFDKLVSAISELHEAISEKNLPNAGTNQFKSLKTWLERPTVYLPERYGAGLPYVDAYNNFLCSKFKTISFKEGNVHWDISPENICMDIYGSIFFIDLEMAHKGALVFDYIRAASIYLEFKNAEVSIDSEIFSKLEQLSRNLAVGMDSESLRFLLSRCVVRNIRGGLMPSSKQEIMPFLGALERFVLGHRKA